MAEIRISATQPIHGGSFILANHQAWREDTCSPSGGSTKELVLCIRDSTIRIWPVDTNKIEQLAKKLKAIADDLREIGYKGPIVAHMEESD